MFQEVNGVNREVLEYYADYFNNQKGSPYPCSNQIVVCGVITNDKNKALSMMAEKGALLIMQGNNNIQWELNNEIWVWKRWNETMRGHRFYKVLVDKDVGENLFRWTRIYCASYCCSMEIV